MIDLLPDRQSNTVTEWLRDHAPPEVISRDRAGAYAEAVRKGAPRAVQVADRFHLLCNLREALEHVVARHGQLIEEAFRQSTHLDRNPSNAKIENLAYLCLECHKNYDMKGNRVQSYTPGEIGVYRDLLYRALGRDQIEWTLTIRVHRSQYDSAKKRIDKAKDLLRDGGVGVILNESPVE